MKINLILHMEKPELGVFPLSVLTRQPWLWASCFKWQGGCMKASPKTLPSFIILFYLFIYFTATMESVCWWKSSCRIFNSTQNWYLWAWYSRQGTVFSLIRIQRTRVSSRLENQDAGNYMISFKWYCHWIWEKGSGIVLLDSKLAFAYMQIQSKKAAFVQLY